MRHPAQCRVPRFGRSLPRSSGSPAIGGRASGGRIEEAPVPGAFRRSPDERPTEENGVVLPGDRLTSPKASWFGTPAQSAPAGSSPGRRAKPSEPRAIRAKRRRLAHQLIRGQQSGRIPCTEPNCNPRLTPPTAKVSADAPSPWCRARQARKQRLRVSQGLRRKTSSHAAPRQ
jgi:hypothetical protein